MNEKENPLVLTTRNINLDMQNLVDVLCMNDNYDCIITALKDALIKRFDAADDEERREIMKELSDLQRIKENIYNERRKEASPKVVVTSERGQVYCNCPVEQVNTQYSAPNDDKKLLNA